MTIQLPEDLQIFVRAQVESGRFASEADAIAAGIRLLRESDRTEAEKTLEGIRRGIEDMNAGRGRPAEEVFVELSREFNLPVDS